MTAQQQLAELNALVADDDFDIPLSETPRFVAFFVDHGPTLDELLKAYLARQSAAEALKQTEYNTLDRVNACTAYDAADDAIFAALRKLTQEA